MMPANFHTSCICERQTLNLPHSWERLENIWPDPVNKKVELSALMSTLKLRDLPVGAQFTRLSS